MQYAILVAVFLTLASPVFANEGRIAVQNGSVSCEGMSIWESDRYQVVGKCQGLIYPFKEQLDRYFLWAIPESGDPIRLAEVEKGLFKGQTDQRFRDIAITAEEDRTPRQPGTYVIVSGSLQSYTFSTVQSNALNQPSGAAAVTTPTPTIKPIVLPTATTGSFSKTNIVLVGILAAVLLWLVFFFRR